MSPVLEWFETILLALEGAVTRADKILTSEVPLQTTVYFVLLSISLSLSLSLSFLSC